MERPVKLSGHPSVAVNLADLDPAVEVTIGLPQLADDILDDPNFMTYRRADGCSVRMVRFDASKGLPLGKWVVRHGTVPMVGAAVVPKVQPARCPTPLGAGWTFVHMLASDLTQAWIEDRRAEQYREEVEQDSLALVAVVAQVHSATMPETKTRTESAQKLKRKTKQAQRGRRRIYGYSRR